MVTEGYAVWGFILFLATGVLVLTGAIFLFVSFLRNRRRRSSVSNAW
jgi:hypothetical protein